jgi:hypothetical protein
MRQTIFFFYLIFVLPCYGQNIRNDTINLSTNIIATKNMKIIRPELTDNFEVLDIEKYKEIGIMKNEIGYDEDDKELRYVSLSYNNNENGITYNLYGQNLSGYTYREMPDDSYIQIAKAYYPNGKIRIKYLIFNNRACNLRIGREYRFDKDGCLNYAVDADSLYDFSIEQVLEYLIEKERVPLKPGVIRLGDYTIDIHRITENNKPLWRVIWIDREPGQRGAEITLKLDGKTGEAVSRTEREEPLMEE